MRDWDPFRLSRELGVLVRRKRAFDRDLSRGRPTLDIFAGRDWPGKTLFEEVSALDDADPLRLPLQRWTFHLVDERVQLGFRAREGWLHHQERHGIREPRDGEFSLAELSALALRTHGPERAGFLQARTRQGRALGAHRVELWARRAEVSRRLGVEHPDVFFAPLHERAALARLASDFLERTRDAARQGEGLAFVGFVEGLLAESAQEGLPAHISPHSLRDLAGHELLRGVRLEPFALPARLVPSSFVLAFSRLGQAWSAALAPGEFPFVVAHDPARLVERRDGALFASWWTRRVFLQRRLALGREASAVTARAFALPFLLEGRRRATAVLLREAALLGRAELERQVGELAVELFGEECSTETLFGCVEVADFAATDFVAFLAAVVRDSDFVEQFDDDYFDAPRAVERLKDEAGRVPPLVFETSDFAGATDTLLREFSANF